MTNKLPIFPDSIGASQQWRPTPLLIGMIRSAWVTWLLFTLGTMFSVLLTFVGGLTAEIPPT